MESNIVHPVQPVLDRINEAAKRSGRTATNVMLVAVSKTKPIEAIVAAYEAGARHFGENRAMELAEKATALSYLPDIQWHFIGHLQTRQSDLVAQHAHCFHAVDRVKIAERLSTQLQEFNRSLLATKLGLVVSAHEALLREFFSNRLGLLIKIVPLSPSGAW